MKKNLIFKKIQLQQLISTILIFSLLIVGFIATQAESVSANGSLEWSFVTIPDLPEGATFPQNSLWSDQPDNLYVWANLNPDTGEQEAFLFHWDGSTWNEELHLTGYIGNDVFGTNSDNVFASAYSTAYDSGVPPLMYRFDGTNWIEQQLPSEVTRIRNVSGVDGEIQAGAGTIYTGQQGLAWIRYNGDDSWSVLGYQQQGNYYLIGPRHVFFLSPSEAYAESCWGHARWNGSNWTVKQEFDFCDIYDMWGTRDDLGQLHLYVVGNNNFSNGIRVWKYAENPNPALLGTFGSKCGFVFGDPINDTYICNGVYAIGGASGIWGSSWNDIYVVGRLGGGTDPDSGRIYHYDGVSWQRMTEFGDLPSVGDVWGSGPNDVWFGLRDGRLLHIGPTNTLPEVTLDNTTVGVDEGQTATNNGTVSDADGDIVSLSASVGVVTNHEDGTWSWGFPTTDGSAESQTVTITANDGNGGTASVSFDLTVNNVAPTIDTVSVPVDPVNINDQPISANATFSDPAGSYDEPYSCTVDYGDESGPKAGVADSTACLGPDHTYAEPGVYAVTVTVTDKDSDNDSALAATYVVIYDPEGGFVTGGGWIWSPLGAYVPDDTLEGKATFGFVSKYKKGATAPTGNTEFQFKVADLNFKSASYDWLVIAGKKAMYKGTGTINGIGEYGFMLSAIDGTPDMFRIKIWDNATEEVIYDNQLGAAEDAEPATELGGGSIVVHKK